MSTERLVPRSIDATYMSRRHVGAENAGYTHISRFWYRAGSILFAIPLPDCDARKGQAVNSSFASVLIDQPPSPLISRLR